MFEIFQHIKYKNCFRYSFFPFVCECACVCSHAHKYVVAYDMYASVQRTENTGCPVRPRPHDPHYFLDTWSLTESGTCWGFFLGGGVNLNSNNPLVSASPSPAPLTALHLAVPSFFVGTGDPNLGPHIITASI